MEGGAGISVNPQANHRSHIDTTFLLALIGAGSDAGLREDATNFIRDWSGPRIGVSLPALGETYLVLTGDPQLRGADPESSPYDRWLQLVQAGMLEICWLDHLKSPQRLLTLTTCILKAMAGIEFGLTDSLIAACAVLCPTSDCLITSDKQMLVVPHKYLKKASGKFLRLQDSFSL